MSDTFTVCAEVFRNARGNSRENYPNPTLERIANENLRCLALMLVRTAIYIDAEFIALKKYHAASEGKQLLIEFLKIADKNGWFNFVPCSQLTENGDSFVFFLTLASNTFEKLLVVNSKIDYSSLDPINRGVTVIQANEAIALLENQKKATIIAMGNSLVINESPNASAKKRN